MYLDVASCLAAMLWRYKGHMVIFSINDAEKDIYMQKMNFHQQPHNIHKNQLGFLFT